MRKLRGAFAIICSVFFLSICCNVNGGVVNVNDAGQQLQPTARPTMIYVANFAIDVANVKEEGALGQTGLFQGRLLRRRGPLRRQEDPAATAANLVNLLAESITQKLKDQGFPALRFPPDQPLPDNGWLVRGQFLQANEGKRLERAVIGFGAGASDMQIAVKVCNLASHPHSPFLTFGADTSSGNMPGAIITKNPYVAAAKFVLAKHASERDVRHAGEQIAAAIIKYMKKRGLVSAH